MNETGIVGVIVIGAGPAGLYCAIHVTRKSGDTLILEKNNSPGRKLLIAGSGQCNITHGGPVRNFFTHYGDHGRFLTPALLNCTNSSVISFFQGKGLGMVTTDGGKVFPATMKSSDVLAVLLEECRNRSVRISYDEAVMEISKENNIFRVKCKAGTYYGRNIVIATGGITYPFTGSTGDGYRFAESFGHSVTEVAPALTPVVIEGYPFADLAGVSFKKISFSLRRDGKKIGAGRGDLLFTHRGISGPGVLDHSRNIRPNDILTLSFLTGFTMDQFSESLAEQVSSHPLSKVKTVISMYGLPDRLIEKLFEFSGVPWDLTCAHLTRSQRKKIIENTMGFPLRVRALGGLNEAMVTRGGVNLTEVNPKTMESRLVPGLFFIGEVLDIDGDTGGYNIQAAFSTGYLAGATIRENMVF
jgi:predicted Rossmann fold flavoprotein